MVEGPDGAGKSTVAKEVAHILASHGGSAPELGCVLQKLSFDSRPGDYVNRPWRWLASDLHVVQDRGVISGPVYEPLKRNDPERMAWLQPLVADAVRLGPLVLYVDAHVDVLKRRLADRGDDYVQPEELEAIQKAYWRQMALWESLGGRVVTLDTTEAFYSRTALALALSASFA